MASDLSYSIRRLTLLFTHGCSLSNLLAAEFRNHRSRSRCFSFDPENIGRPLLRPRNHSIVTEATTKKLQRIIIIFAHSSIAFTIFNSQISTYGLQIPRLIPTRARLGPCQISHHKIRSGRERHRQIRSQAGGNW